MIQKSGTNSEDVQDMNRALVIDLLRQKQPCSRAELAVQTGLQKATITNIVADLMRWNLVQETGTLRGEKGRRAVGLALNRRHFKVLAVRLARHFYRIAVADLWGFLEESHTETIAEDETPPKTLARIRAHLATHLAKQTAMGCRVLGIGMGVPGPVLFQKGRIAYNLAEFPGWQALSLTQEMKEAFPVPFFYDHDANLGALAEWTYGKHKRQSGALMFVAAGDGIGSGLVMQGKVQHGAQGFLGEIGHASINYQGQLCGCGNRGCLNQYASGHSLVQNAKSQLPRHPQSLLANQKEIQLKTIRAAVGQKDSFALALLQQTAHFLGLGLVNAINCFDPSTIIVGDTLSLFGEPFLQELRKTVNECVQPEISAQILIEPSSFEADSVLLGAAALAIGRVMEHPTAHFSSLEE